MRLLITRPKKDAASLAGALAGLGHEAVAEPLLEMHFHEPEIDAGRYRAFLTTSANGVRAAMRAAGFDALKALPVYAVGPASAREAREAGFGEVHVAGGDVAKLADTVAGALAAGGKPLLHISGAAAAGDLKGDLEGRGFAVERVVGYEARARDAFSPGLCDDLRAGRIDGVLLYSPRTAAIFTRLATEAGLGAVVRGLRFFCLSQAVANKLAVLGDVDARVAASPTQPALLGLIAAQA